MRYSRRLLYVASLSWIYCGQAVTVYPQEVTLRGKSQVKAFKEGIIFTGTIPERTTAGENIRLLLEIKNSGKGTIMVDDDITYALVMRITTKEGTMVPKTMCGKREYDRPKQPFRFRANFINLHPEKKASVTIDLGLLYDFTTGGQYVATIEFLYRNGTTLTTALEEIKIENLEFNITGISLPLLTEKSEQENRGPAKKSSSVN